MMRRILLALVLCLLASVSEATTYYVRTDGNDANTGTANTAGGAWRHIDYGADHAAAGDTVRVQAGTYVETASPGVSGTAGVPVTLVADGGVVTTCAMTFAAKSYIRVIGFALDPSTGGCTLGPGISGTGTNTGLELWNNSIANTGANNGITFDGGASVRCDKCIILGGSVTTVGTGSQTAIRVSGDDVLVGYVNVTAIQYLGVGPSGVRGRFLNVNFSGLIQGGSSHPDFYYIATDALGWNTNLVESNYGVGTITSTDNKFFHAQNDSAAAWNDNVWRGNVAYNMGSGFFSMYATTNAENRWRFYHNTIVGCDRANNEASYDNCGNLSAAFGPVLSASIYNSVFYNAWADVVTAPVVWSESSSPTVTKDYNLAFSSLGTMTFAAQWTGQAHEQSNVDPVFNNAANDFTLQSTSGARSTGGPLTLATSCSGSTLNVTANTGSFFVGDNSANLAAYGGALVPGDFITVNATTYHVASVAASALTLTTSITCANGDAVYFGPSTDPHDIGAYPFKSGGYALSATYTLTGGTAVAVTANDASLVRFVVCYENGIPTTVDNASPYTCTVTSGATLDLRVYPKYASTTLYATATTASVPVITTASPLAQQTQNVAVSGVTISGTCTDTPCVWTSDIANAGACTGVTFTSTNSTTATIGGTPTTAGVCSFHATTTDANILADTDAFTMTVNAAGTGAGFPTLRLRTP